MTGTKVEGKVKEEIICWDLISKEALEMSVSIQISNIPDFWWDGIQLDINEDTSG